MIHTPVQRRLAAIISADMVSYSRHMGAHEEGTLARLKALREQLIDPKVSEHEGRIVKLMGDGALIEFRSAVSAVRCAVEVQRAIDLDQRAMPKDERIQFRIGINLGDIIIEGDDIYGDGVNVAARLEALAEPGGICMSAKVYNEVHNKLEIGFADLGEQRFKNIAEAIRTYRVNMDPQSTLTTVAPGTRRRGLKRWAAVTVALAIVVAAGVTLWQKPWKAVVEPTSFARMTLPLPDKPSIAILAFKNLSGDPEQEYFADGIAEDIITDLSRLPGLFVIARNSSFYYKDKSIRIPQVAQELGIRYILEGSVRKVGGTVRVNAQLIDSTTGGHVWAERYDRPLGDVFKIQDDITRRIVSALAVKLVSEHNRQLVQGTRNVAAYDIYLKGWSHLRKTTPADTAEAVTLFKTAITIDPSFSRAHAALAAAYLLARRLQWHKSLDLPSRYDTETLAFQHIDLAMRSPSALAFRVRADMNYREGRFRNSLDDLAEAQARDPNDAAIYAQLGLVYIKMGRAADAAAPMRMAMRLDPNQPMYSAMLGIAEFVQAHFGESARLIKDAFKRNPEDHAHLDHLIAAYAYLGQLEEAGSRLDDMNALRTRAGIEPYTMFVTAKSPFYGNDCDLFRLREGLRKAGVPAGPEPEPPIKGVNCTATPSR